MVDRANRKCEPCPHTKHVPTHCKVAFWASSNACRCTPFLLSWWFLGEGSRCCRSNATLLYNASALGVPFVRFIWFSLRRTQKFFTCKVLMLMRLLVPSRCSREDVYYQAVKQGGVQLAWGGRWMHSQPLTARLTLSPTHSCRTQPPHRHPKPSKRPTSRNKTCVSPKNTC
jgi:hypothetical protein